MQSRTNMEAKEPEPRTGLPCIYGLWGDGEVCSPPGRRSDNEGGNR